MAEKSFSSISKTSFLKFDQCAKAFFLYKNFNYLKDPISKEKQLTFNRGHAVGFAAQELFPGGTDVSKETSNVQEAAKLTAELVSKNHPVIYEATFVYNNVLVMVDILCLGEDGWEAYEVKSSLKINDTYVKDACLQYYVLKNSLTTLHDFYLVNLNGDYVLKDELNYKELFKKRSIKKDGEKNFTYFEHQIERMMLLLEQNAIPDIAIGKHCFSPYACDFMGTCWKGISEPTSVFNIGKIDKEQLFSWFASGIKTVENIPADSDLKPFVTLQAQSIQHQKEYFNVPEIKKFLDSIKGVSCFLDMEIWGPAIPFYKGTSPFEQIPFLFSLCYLHDEKVKFINYLKPVESDSRDEFLDQLLASTQQFDTVIVYDKNLEVHVLRHLEKLFPSRSSAIQALILKMKDISDPVHNFHYYHPNFKGNFSLKAVSEVVSGNEGYEQQQISSGLIAMNAYATLMDEKNPIIAETIKQQLIDYCNLDTLTGMKFFNYLQQKIKGL